jgi:hypothetical protein
MIKRPFRVRERPKSREETPRKGIRIGDEIPKRNPYVAVQRKFFKTKFCNATTSQVFDRPEPFSTCERSAYALHVIMK